MRKNRPKAPKSEDYMEAAESALELAKVLAGEGGVSDQDFLERMARSDELVDHDGETCGLCYYTFLGAEVARDMIEAGEYEDVVTKWAAEHERRWGRASFSSYGSKRRRLAAIPIRRSRNAVGSLEPGQSTQ